MRRHTEQAVAIEKKGRAKTRRCALLRLSEQALPVSLPTRNQMSKDLCVTRTRARPSEDSCM